MWINNAGVVLGKYFLDASFEEHMEVTNVNYISQVLILKKVLQFMIK